MKTIKKHLFPIFLLMFISTAICPMKTYAETFDETVRIGCFPLNGFFNISNDGTKSGYGFDYTKEVLTHAGWKYEFVVYKSWVEALAALSRNEIDILSPAQHTEERDKLYTFDSYPIATEYGALLTLSTSDDLIYEDFEKFNGMKVGCVKSLIFLDGFINYQQQNDFEVELSYYKDTPALVAALNVGEVDAILANMMVKTESMKLLSRFGTAQVYYMLSPEASHLVSLLNQSIDEVSSVHPGLQHQLNSKYFASFENLPLSKAEIDYIAKCGTLNVACGAKYVPFSYVNNETGQIDGVGRTLFEQIAQISGLKFSYFPIPFSQDISSFIKENNISLVSGVENTSEHQMHDTQFSNSYLKIIKYFAGLKDTSFNTELNLKIAVVSNTEAQISAWKELYPNFEFVRYPSISACIDAIHKGSADFLLHDRYSMEIILSNPRNQDIELLPIEGITSNICFKTMVPEEESVLLTSILNKSMTNISNDSKDRIINDYMQKNKYQYSFSDFIYLYRTQVICFVILLIAILASLIYINRVQTKARKSIEENELKLRHITNNIKGGVIVLKKNKGLEITFANDGFLELIGCTRKDFESSKGGSYLAYVHPDDLSKLHAAIESDEYELSMELRVMKTNGEYVPALFNCTTGERGINHKELYCVIMDITEQNKLLEQLRIENRRTELILNTVEEVFYEVNLQTGAITTSSSFFEKFGWTLPEKLSETPVEQFGSMWKASSDDIEKLRQDTRSMNTKKEPVITQLKLQCHNEGLKWFEILQYPLLAEDNSVATVIGLIRDVNDKMIEREHLIKKAQLDQLTGLYNKEAFEHLVNESIHSMKDENHAIVFIDLDHFKNINDTLGHMTGDKAICEAADKLKIIFSNYDIISRFGGDEFCIFVKNIPVETLRGKMSWLIDKLQADYHNEKGNVRITCSCGIACTSYFGFEYSTLMQKADEALYYSKNNGRNQFTFAKSIQNQTE